MEFQEKAQKSEEIAVQQRAVKKQMDRLAWKQHSKFPSSWTAERNERITALGKEYDRLGAEARAVWQDETPSYAEKVMAKEANQEILEEFFTGIASCEYYDGSCYRLQLDTDDDSLSIDREASTNTWLQRDDGSLVMIWQISGYSDTPEAERYTDGCDLCDYGYTEWLDQVAEKIEEANVAR